MKTTQCKYLESFAPDAFDKLKSLEQTQHGFALALIGSIVEVLERDAENAWFQEKADGDHDEWLNDE